METEKRHDSSGHSHNATSILDTSRESSAYEENRTQLDKEHHLRESSPFLSTDRRLPYGNCDSMTQGVIWQGLPRGTARAWHGASPEVLVLGAVHNSQGEISLKYTHRSSTYKTQSVCNYTSLSCPSGQKR